ncbi:P27 family phage terminase small subunit, partial [Escherichia sp. TWPC-MK]
NKGCGTLLVSAALLTKKKQLHEQMKSLAIEFGLTPSSRASLAKPKGDDKPKTNAEKRFGDRV